MADFRLSDLLVALSGVTDLGMGQPPETAARCCWLATRLAVEAEVGGRIASDVYYTTLLQHIGCTAYAHETASLFGGDDIALRAEGANADNADLREFIGFLVLGIGRGAPLPVRLRAVLAAVRLGASFDEALSRANCEVARDVVNRIGLGPGVQAGLAHIYERWDGKGAIHKIGKADVALAARFAHVADQAVRLHRLGGTDFALEAIRGRSGGWLDPEIADLFLQRGGHLLAELDVVDPVVAAIDAEPEPRFRVADDRIDQVARAFGDMVDVKSPYTHGHSTAVSRLAEAAAKELGLLPVEVLAIRRAGFLHDLGHAGVPNGIWDKPGPLTSAELESVRLHPYYAQRIVARSEVLASLAPMVGMHHERLDGTGYPHGVSGQAIPVGARVIAVANIYQVMTEDRPHRLAHPTDAAAEQLRIEAAEGRLDHDAVNAVLSVAGHGRHAHRRAWPAGLTDREVGVLNLAARGLSAKEIGAALSISPKTAGHHIQHIYAKIGVSTRAGAAMFAMEHDLVHGTGSGE
jgi:HD-GYP domain-containing protein (c-di-GMP phosphodiesterase class II)